MSYLKELQDHYKAVRGRIKSAALQPPKALPKPTQKQLTWVEPSEPKRAGLVPEGAEGRLVTEALRQANPDWVGGNHAQALKIAEEMASAPRLPPLPGLVLNEIGAIRWMRVLHAVAAYHKVPASEILGVSRKRHIAQARFEVFYRLRVDLNMSYTKIATLMKKDHSTIMHGVSRMREKLLDEHGAVSEDGLLVGKHPPASEAHHTQPAG